jgi:hypothetical protein
VSRPSSFPPANERTGGRLAQRLREWRAPGQEKSYDRIAVLLQAEFGEEASRSKAQRWCDEALALEDELA